MFTRQNIEDNLDILSRYNDVNLIPCDREIVNAAIIEQIELLRAFDDNIGSLIWLNIAPINEEGL